MHQVLRVSLRSCRRRHRNDLHRGPNRSGLSRPPGVEPRRPVRSVGRDPPGSRRETNCPHGTSTGRVGSRTREYRECAAIRVSVTMMHHDSQSYSWHFSCQVFTVNGVGIPALLDLWKGGLHGLHPSCTECHCPKAHLVTCRLDPRKRVRAADSVDGERIRPRHGRYSRDRRPLRSHRGQRTRFVRVPAELGNSAAQTPGEPRNGAIAATSTPRDLIPPITTPLEIFERGSRIPPTPEPGSARSAAPRRDRCPHRQHGPGATIRSY